MPGARGATPEQESIKLTKCELEVLRVRAVGLTNVQIAERLVISQVSVNSSLHSIQSKLGVSLHTAAMRSALDHRLV